MCWVIFNMCVWGPIMCQLTIFRASCEIQPHELIVVGSSKVLRDENNI